MSDAAEQKIDALEKELRVAQELLFLVLDKVGEPVVLNIAEAKERMKNDRAIDLDLNEKESLWTLQVVDIGHAV